MTPFQRRAQRLMPWEHDAGTRCEQVEAFAEVRAQAFKPEQRQPRRREFYCQRNPVQALAYLDLSRNSNRGWVFMPALRTV